MIVYNMTIKVAASLTDDWLDWAINEHIPAIQSTGLFVGHRFHRLLEQDETEGSTFVLQFDASPDNYRRYLAEYATSLRHAAFEKWGEGFIAFHTSMERIPLPAGD